MAVAVIATSVAAAYSQREHSRREWTEQLASMSLMLAEHLSQAMVSANAAMDSIEVEIGPAQRVSSAEFERLSTERVVHEMLADHIASNPVIGTALLVALDGRLLSGAHDFPAATMSLADRDYLRAHLADQALRRYVSAPFRNKQTGRWMFAVTRPVRSQRGQLLGLIVVGVSLDWFNEFYSRVGTSLGEGASMSLWRDDFMLMARWPLVEDQIGKVMHNTGTYKLIGEQRRDHGVYVTDGPREFGPQQFVMRITAPRRVVGQPFIVTASISEDLFLQKWRDSLWWIIASTFLSLLLLGVCVRALMSADRKLRAELAERVGTQASLRIAHEHLESRVAERTLALTTEMTQREQAQRELARMNERIADASRRAGMAEVANSVLHNVGNVLNSVNVSVNLLGEQLRATPLLDLPRATGLLADHQADLVSYLTHDPQGRQLPDFLVMLGRQWQHEHELLKRETDQLTASVQHIKDIVARQQSLSGLTGVVGAVDVPAVVAEVAALHGEALRRHRVELLTEHCGPVLWQGDRGKITQILLNLVVNAEEAMSATEPDPERMRQIVVSCVMRDDASLLVGVQDNGPGIEPEVLARLFSYGHTTKPDGHGYGLHASALAAQEMGGSLSARSAGVGQGALFILDLPDGTPGSPGTPGIAGTSGTPVASGTPSRSTTP